MTVSAGLPSRETEWKFIGSLPLPLVKSAPTLPSWQLTRHQSELAKALGRATESARGPSLGKPPRAEPPPQARGIAAAGSAARLPAPQPLQRADPRRGPAVCNAGVQIDAPSAIWDTLVFARIYVISLPLPPGGTRTCYRLVWELPFAVSGVTAKVGMGTATMLKTKDAELRQTCWCFQLSVKTKTANANSFYMSSPFIMVYPNSLQTSTRGQESKEPVIHPASSTRQSPERYFKNILPWTTN